MTDAKSDFQNAQTVAQKRVQDYTSAVNQGVAQANDYSNQQRKIDHDRAKRQ